MLTFQILKMTKDMETKTGETIITAEVEAAISLEAVDTSKEVAIPTITTKIETVDGEIEVVKAEVATVVAETRVAGVTDGMTIEIETMMMMVVMEEVAGATEIEVDIMEVEDTKDKAHTPTTVVLISDLEPKGHPEVKHQALDPLNRKASLVDQDVLYT